MIRDATTPVKWARTIFLVAGVWGVAVLTPLFFLTDISGRVYPPPTSYPHFFYGFLVVAMAWQIAFLVIGWNPLQYRPLMVPAMIEKFGFVSTLSVMYARGIIPSEDAIAAVPDFVLGVFFIVAWMMTRP